MRNGLTSSPIIVVDASAMARRLQAGVAAGTLEVAYAALRILNQRAHLIGQFTHIGTQRIDGGIQIGFGRRLLVGRQRPQGRHCASRAGARKIGLLVHAPEIATPTSMTPDYAEKRPDTAVELRCHSVLECPVQRLVRVHSVHGLSGCDCPSWHTLGTTGDPPGPIHPLSVVTRSLTKASAVTLFLRAVSIVIDHIVDGQLLDMTVGPAQHVTQTRFQKTGTRRPQNHIPAVHQTQL